MSGGKRIFSEQEASEILQRAAKLQEEDRESDPAYTPGITAEELERIAHEAGIDPNFCGGRWRRLNQWRAPSAACN